MISKMINLRNILEFCLCILLERLHAVTRNRMLLVFFSSISVSDSKEAARFTAIWSKTSSTLFSQWVSTYQRMIYLFLGIQLPKCCTKLLHLFPCLGLLCSQEQPRHMSLEISFSLTLRKLTFKLATKLNIGLIYTANLQYTL